VRRPFHLAFPVKDLAKTRAFFHGLLGCPVGRESGEWIDFDFFGNQITAHLKPGECAGESANAVDGDAVPVRHFGAILEWAEWERLAEILQSRNYPFEIQPKIRFKGKAGEQGTFFVRDPSGNALEFKAFKSKAQVFAKEAP